MIDSTPLIAPPRRGLHSVATGCAWWSVLAFVTLGLTLAAPHGILRRPELTLGDRVLLVSSELASLGVLVALATAAGSVAAVLNVRHALAKERGWTERPPSADEFIRAAAKDAKREERRIE